MAERKCTAPRTGIDRKIRLKEDMAKSRRGFLRQTALVVGAFVVGVGRNESAFAAGYCFFCSNKCNDQQKKDCNANHSLTLTWAAQGGGTCVECYKSANDRANAEASAQGCNYCVNVECGYYRGTGDEREEPAVSSVVDAGVGCIDPETGYIILWSEPGTPCDNRSPHQELSHGDQ